MNKEFIEEINKILSEKEIDERVKPLIKLYFLGKLNNGLKLEDLTSQMDTLCTKIANVEFTSSNIVAGYSSKANVLTINKQLFQDGKAEEAILPVFMKFESALNQDNRKDYANHIEDFIRAGRIAKAITAPISKRLYQLYEMAEYCYGDIENETGELQKDSAWTAACSQYNNALNKMIVSGKDNVTDILNGANLFHYKTFTIEALQNPNFEGPYKNEEYQKKAATILGVIDNLNFNTNLKKIEKEGLQKNIQLFTGCTDAMIQDAKAQVYTGNATISDILASTMQSKPKEITEEYIASKVQAMLDRKPEYSSRVKHLIIPFFIRSQKIYNWDIDEFQERLNQIDLKIDKIEFEDLGDITTMGDTATNKIRLNSRVFYNRNRKTILACNHNFVS